MRVAKLLYHTNRKSVKSQNFRLYSIYRFIDEVCFTYHHVGTGKLITDIMA